MLRDVADIYSGSLPRRDAHREEADAALVERDGAWPVDDSEKPVSPYRDAFRQGATLVPRRLVIVERVTGGRLGANPEAPVIRGRTSSQDKKPWKNLPPLSGPVEAAFLHPTLLGESMAPFRVLDAELGLIPLDPQNGQFLDGARARTRGFPRLADRLSEAESLWREHGKGRRCYRQPTLAFIPRNERGN
jgi:hypothetical protein